ncbi:hypothetical protein [Flavobacterium sp.]|uniref:hypothetical protein n=1 Tax=Flavobacterium sp. TaxID=239 RepID=UPI002BFED8F2|nr:hypothetical protein [Flavobacterium sp.]HSD08960.1 hypothetical protein [Flavobacterium sp.]
MKQLRFIYFVLLFLIFFSNTTYSQFGLSTDVLKLGTSLLGVDKLFKKPAAITTAFENVNKEGSQMPDFFKLGSAQPLYLLPKAPTGGFVLCAGYYEMTNKSYCLHAGTFAPSKGDGYMYAPTEGSKKEIVTAILKSAENHPEIEQHKIQVLLWAIIAKTKFVNFSTEVKLTAVTLLTKKQLSQLEDGALGFLPDEVINQAKAKLPESVQTVFEAENSIRGLITSGNYTYQEMEKYAILAGIAPPRTDYPSGIWTLHPDGYYVRYIPSGYSVTKVQIYVPKELIISLNGKSLIYDATNDIACPANTGSQRLAQTNEPLNPDYTIVIKTDCNNVN